MSAERIPVLTREGAVQLRKHLEDRLKDYRETLEDPRIDDKPGETIGLRHRINEIKDILDQFDIPAA